MITRQAPAKIPIENLTTAWFQVSGTLCNLSCTHCFISCGPGGGGGAGGAGVKRHGMMSRQLTRGYLEEAGGLGIEEVYLTGGEPFLNPELPEIIADALKVSSVTVLTNATLITRELASRLGEISKDHKNELVFRVSVESPEEEKNDRIRGKGSYGKAVLGIKNLLSAGFNPIVTTTSTGRDVPLDGFGRWLEELGSPEPRVKTLPMVYLGRAEESIRAYRPEERVTEDCLKGFPLENLQCTSSRMVTSEGVFVCPILIDDPLARMGETLSSSLTPYEAGSPACYTCVASGLCCSNTGTVSRDDVRSFYTDAAREPQGGLCCPTAYEGAQMSHIPEEVLEVSYGCGSPVALAGIRPGETMLDLGSGAGIDCFIASRLVGPAGKVIGVDMTTEMLEKAQRGKRLVAGRLGYDNVEFRLGFLEKIPVDSSTVDLVTSNCVVNLSVDKIAVFNEIYRVLKDRGRFVISDIVSDRPVPDHMRRDKTLWGECISGAMTTGEFMAFAREAAFQGTAIIARTPYRQVNGLNFHSVTFSAHKFVKGPECVYMGHSATYKGPFDSITDDDGHVFPRGTPVEVCTDTAEKLKNPPYEGTFIITDPAGEAEKEPEPCKPGCC